MGMQWQGSQPPHGSPSSRDLTQIPIALEGIDCRLNIFWEFNKMRAGAAFSVMTSQARISCLGASSAKFSVSLQLHFRGVRCCHSWCVCILKWNNTMCTRLSRNDNVLFLWVIKCKRFVNITLKMLKLRWSICKNYVYLKCCLVCPCHLL